MDSSVRSVFCQYDSLFEILAYKKDCRDEEGDSEPKAFLSVTVEEKSKFIIVSNSEFCVKVLCARR